MVNNDLYQKILCLDTSQTKKVRQRLFIAVKLNIPRGYVQISWDCTCGDQSTSISCTLSVIQSGRQTSFAWPFCFLSFGKDPSPVALFFRPPFFVLLLFFLFQRPVAGQNGFHGKTNVLFLRMTRNKPNYLRNNPAL